MASSKKAAKKTAAEARVTHFGSKSAPEGTPHHFYRWSGKASGQGIGTCIYCGVQVEWQEKGARGGKQRRWKVKGHWTPTEPACKRKEEKAAA